MRILKDPSLSVHHTAVVQAVMYIFKTLGLKCVPFLPHILPPLLNVMKSCQIGILEFYFQQLGILVTIVKQHIRNYLDGILGLIQEFWNPMSNIQITIISLIESIAVALDSEFKVYLPKLLPNLIQLFDGDTSEKRLPTQKALHALTLFGSNLEEYLHLIIPAMVKLFEKVDNPIPIRKYAIQTTGQLCKKINFSDHASRIVHPLARVLQQPHIELRMAAMDTLSALVFQLSTDYVVFIPMINKIIVRQKIQHQLYDLLISKLLKNEPLPQELGVEAEERYQKILGCIIKSLQA
jgi:FKBP12-rapamycin complex-associated protein